MAGTTNVLITGANRGIGKGLLEVYLSRPNHIVVAGVRDPNSSSSKGLESLPHGEGSKVVLVKIESISETDAKAAVELLKSKHQITKLDVVIANAGISNYYGEVGVTPLKEFTEHYQVNTLGPVILFQAVLPLIDAASTPKFIIISTEVASISSLEHIPLKHAAYGSSKAATNFVAKKIHVDYPNIIAFPLSPGWLQTDMGNAGAASIGLDAAPVALEEGVKGIINEIDTATKETTSGKFASYDGRTLAW